MLKMNKIFLFIFVFQYIKAEDGESDEKYIDLLPEEEKQGFLNRIARRILEGVTSTDTPNESHAEVNEDQLDAQNAYVKQIIKEESTILENDKRDNLLRKFQEKNNKGNKNSDDEPQIDLTLRSQSRDDRNGTELNEYLDKTKELEVIPVLNDQENLNASANGTKSNVNGTKSIRDKDITIEVGKAIQSVLITANDSKSTENINIIRKSYEKFSTTISNYDPSSEENNLATKDKITDSLSTIRPDYIDNGNTTDTDSKIIWISTKKIYDTEKINSESAETTLSTLSTLTDEDQETTSSITNSTLEREKSEQETTTSKTTENSSNFNQTRSKNKNNTRFKHLYVRSEDRDLKNILNITELMHNNMSDLKTNENDTDSVNNIVNNTISETNIMNSNDTKNTSDARSIYLDNNNNEENITDLKAKESHISLRAMTDSRDSKIDELQDHHLKSDAKVYEVFEVAADEPPFVMKSKVEIKDTPYYFPVYNYAPDRVYYRPRSRFGPNADNTNEDNKNFNTYQNINEDSPSTRSKFSGYNKKKKTLYGNKSGIYIMKQQNDKIFDLKRPVKINNVQDISYNPNDYLDMDYYFGRTYVNPLRNSNAGTDDKEEDFPNSDEEDHPYTSIHGSESVKDHIRAVRKLLYLKHTYEPVQGINKKEPRKFYDKRIQNNDITYNKRDELRHNNVDNIAIANYFGIVPNNKAVQGLTILKPNNNKVLRNPEKNKIVKTNDYDDKLNESKLISKTSAIEIKVKTTLDKVFEPILNVLRDFIRFDNQALSKYNWLESTVDILAAIKKLLELTTQLQFQEDIHPNDLELLKYVLYLYKSSVNTFEQNVNSIKDSNRKGVKNKKTVKQNKNILPKNKWNNKIRKPLKLWFEVSTFIRSGGEKEERVKLLYDFEDFLQNVMFSLHDFHDAIKHIAIITKYNNQKWYEDLKNIYLHNASNEKLLTLLLHVSVTKLLNSIETSASDGAENNFKNYIINNKQYVQRSKEEFLFVLNILHELRRMNKH